jgi:DNA-binding PadR family transcriptional regulator
MKEKLSRKLQLSFIRVHVLYHASKAPFYGVWMLEELSSHGYDFGPSTIYPLLKEMTFAKILSVENKVIDGKQRKYYSITNSGKELLTISIHQVKQLLLEIKENNDEKTI